MIGGKRTFVIAEAGVNHNGSLDVALDLVAAARDCGADAVKFQTFDAGRLATRAAAKAAYQKEAVPDGDSQYEMLKSLELNSADFERIAEQCRDQNIEFMSSPFDEAAADLLAGLGMRRFKIPSGEITNLPLLRHVAGKGGEVFLSTGMSWLSEVEAAVTQLLEGGASKLTLLHCVTQYPTPCEQVNLRAMSTLAAAFGLPVGYSDHTVGVEVAIAAAALGATVVEKHFTLDTSMSGPDHRASLAPFDFARMVQAIRNVDAALGDGRKRPAQCELANIGIVRRSIAVCRDIVVGETIRSEDLALMRPGTGIPPRDFERVVGRVAQRHIAAGSLVKWQDLS